MSAIRIFLRMLVSVLLGIIVVILLFLMSKAILIHPEYAQYCVALFIIGFVAWASYNILLDKGY